MRLKPFDGTVKVLFRNNTSRTRTRPRWDQSRQLDTQPPPADWTVMLGVVALPAAPRVPALETFRCGLRDPAARLFSKAGLIIRAGTAF